MSPLPVIGSGSGGISASYLNQLIQQTMALQRKPLEALQAEQSQLRIRRAVYHDLKGMLENLRTEAAKLSAGSDSVVSQKKVTVGDTSIVTASAAAGAAAGVYNITNVTLASAHQLYSGQFAYANQALNLMPGAADRTIYLGGRAESAANLLSRGTAYGSDLVGSFGRTATLGAGQTELASDTYYVEMRNNGTEETPEWEFRLVDGRGEAVSMRDEGSGETPTYTSGWQDFADVNQETKTYDTGRGLTITFDTPGARLGTTQAAAVDYSARGAALTIDAGDSLYDIRDKINSATYVRGNDVQAGIVGNRLVLSGSRLGYKIEASGELLGASGLGFGSDTNSDGEIEWTNTTRAATVGSATVNGIQVQLWANTGLTHVVGGLTLNFLKETAAGATVSLAVENDTAAVLNQVNSFVSNFNKASSYLRDKTATTKNTDGTYTRATLAGDNVFASLRLNLLSDIVRPVEGLGAGTPASLREIGLAFNVDSLQLQVSDSGKLSEALGSNHKGVAALLDAVMDRVTARLDKFTGNQGTITNSVARFDKDDENLSERIKSMEERMAAEEMILTRRYARTLAQYAQVQAQASYLFGINQTA